MLYNHFHVDQALQLIASDERFTQPLILHLLPTDEGEEPVPAAANVDPIIVDAIDSSPQVEGDLPATIPDQREYSTTASLSLGLTTRKPIQGCLPTYTRLYLLMPFQWALMEHVFLAA